jgi:hypothetical protein
MKRSEVDARLREQREHLAPLLEAWEILGPVNDTSG